MTTKTLPLIDEGTWQRMSWHARQQWLRAADALRRQLTADIDATMRRQAARAAQAKHVHSTTLVAAQAILDALGPDPDGHAHLEALEPPRTRTGREPGAYRRTPEYRAAEAQRARDRRARQRQTAA